MIDPTEESQSHHIPIHPVPKTTILKPSSSIHHDALDSLLSFQDLCHNRGLLRFLPYTPSRKRTQEGGLPETITLGGRAEGCWTLNTDGKWYTLQAE